MTIMIFLIMSCCQHGFPWPLLTPRRSSRLHPVSAQGCWIYVQAGHPTLARPCVGAHRSTSLINLSLLLKQCAVNFGLEELVTCLDEFIIEEWWKTEPRMLLTAHCNFFSGIFFKQYSNMRLVQFLFGLFVCLFLFCFVILSFTNSILLSI